MTERAAIVGVVGGSRSDFPILERATALLEMLDVPCELRVVSAHRSPDHLFAYAEAAASVTTTTTAPAGRSRRTRRA